MYLHNVLILILMRASVSKWPSHETLPLSRGKKRVEADAFATSDVLELWTCFASLHSDDERSSHLFYVRPSITACFFFSDVSFSVKKIDAYHQHLLDITADEERNQLSVQSRQELAQENLIKVEVQTNFEHMFKRFNYIKAEIATRTRPWESLGETKQEFDLLYPDMKVARPI